MALSVGTRLGAYEVLSLLGVGGMGEVYRAKDTKLGRDVALKILPEAFVSDPERLARFQREAQVLATLNDPHIGAIYGLEESGGVRALVLELVEGRTLADRIALGPIPLDESLAIARQIADALEAAHEQGIIHRDLKPANIKVRDDGTVKVLDFGLARVVEDSGAGRHPSRATLTNSPTITSPVLMTGVGTLLGTAAYMAPEQARGRPADKRSDIWAFGCVVYEMLTGRRAIPGEEMTDVIAAIVRDEPDWQAIPADTPAAVVSCVRRCLRKDPKVRLRDIGDARIALTEASEEPSRPQTAAVVARRPWRWVALAVAAAAGLSATAAWYAKPIAPAGRVVRFDIQPLPNTPLRLDSRPAVGVSPDGSTVVYAAVSEGVSRLFVRSLDRNDTRVLAGTEDATEPAFSPDGRWIAFATSTALKKVSLDGTVVSLATGNDPRGLAWIDNATIAFTPETESGLVRVSADGGSTSVLTTVDKSKGERSHRWPASMPGGKAVLFTIGDVANPDSYDSSQVDALVLATGKRQTVFKGASFVRYLPTGHLLLSRGGSLYAVAFDPDRLQTSGAVVPVLPGVSADITTGATHFSVAGDGTLTYVPGGSSNQRRLVWVDRKGVVEPLNAAPAIYNDPKLSPDGSRVALIVGASGTGDVWVYDLRRSAMTRLTFDGTNASPLWADNRTLYYASIKASGTETRILRKPADGSREAESVAAVDARSYLEAMDPSGAAIFIQYGSIYRSDVLKVYVDGKRSPEAIAKTPAREYSAAVSPDARWLAYVSDETNRTEVYVRDLTSTGARWQISSDGGVEPHWSADGRELTYRADTRLMEVDVETRPVFHAGTPKILAKGIYVLRTDTGMSFDLDRKSGRFLMIRPADDRLEEGREGIRVVLNWLADVRRLTSEKP